MPDLLIRHPGMILGVDLDGPEWQRGSVFNPSVLRLGDKWRMLFRATRTANFAVVDEYVSRIGVADSTDGVHWAIRKEPLIIPTLPEEQGMGCEDPRATIVAYDRDPDSAVVKILYNGLEMHKEWAKPRVKIMYATATHDFKRLEKHGVLLATNSSDQIRLKAAALFPDALPNGKWPFVFTFGSESPYGPLMYVDHLSLDELEDGISPEAIAAMFVNTRGHNVLLPPPVPVERGPEVGSSPIRVGNDYIMFYCPANQSVVRRWGIGVLLIDGISRRIIGHLPELLIPQTDEELSGVVNNVTFPSGAVFLPENDEIRIYYGGGDARILMAHGSMSAIIAATRAAGYEAPAWPY